jgi:hypothetical protein
LPRLVSRPAHAESSPKFAGGVTFARSASTRNGRSFDTEVPKLVRGVAAGLRQLLERTVCATLLFPIARSLRVSEKETKLHCGIVMPISKIDGCEEGHWAEVRSILNQAVVQAGFEPNLVSDADDVGIIHKRIIQNLYDNPIVVCDVSGKNPNVMFELGLRLAFDKPTVIVKDNVTSYSFDTSGIEHLQYPRDLRYAAIIDFKQKLAEKIAATHKRATSDESYTTFLKHFGEFKVAKIEKKEVSSQEFILEEIRSLKDLVKLNTRGRRYPPFVPDDENFPLSRTVEVCIHDLPEHFVKQIIDTLKRLGISRVGFARQGAHNHLQIDGIESLKQFATVSAAVRKIFLELGIEEPDTRLGNSCQPWTQ